MFYSLPFSNELCRLTLYSSTISFCKCTSSCGSSDDKLLLLIIGFPILLLLLLLLLFDL